MFSLVSCDGDQGYPGTVMAQVGGTRDTLLYVTAARNAFILRTTRFDVLVWCALIVPLTRSNCILETLLYALHVTRLTPAWPTAPCFMHPILAMLPQQAIVSCIQACSSVRCDTAWLLPVASVWSTGLSAALQPP